jgi:hypothetical protein
VCASVGQGVVIIGQSLTSACDEGVRVTAIFFSIMLLGILAILALVKWTLDSRT